MWRTVCAARASPSSTASRNPSGDDAMISVTRATATAPGYQTARGVRKARALPRGPGGATFRAMARATVPADVDLTDLARYADGPPHADFARLRAEAPVAWHPERDGPGFWACTRWDEVLAVSRDSATFSSWAGGTMLEDTPPPLLEMARLMMLNMDPPQHTTLRALVRTGFTPRRVAALAPRVAALSAQIVDAVAARGRCDLVTDVAGELPSYVIAELTGIPLDDGRQLYRLTERMHTTDHTPEGQLAGAMAIGEMLTYAGGVRAEKLARPADDIATRLVHAEVDGERLSEAEFQWFFLLLINAGGDTTRNLVGGGLRALLLHPAELARLRAEPALLPSAVEEMLRWCSPVVHFRRTATRDVVLGGQGIAAGDKVVIFYASANRDAAVFADPDRFDVARAPNDHVAFGGGGAHFCLGAHLARLEAQALVREVLRRLDGLQLDGPVEWLPSVFISGPRRLPVRFRPAAPRGA